MQCLIHTVHYIYTSLRCSIKPNFFPPHNLGSRLRRICNQRDQEASMLCLHYTGDSLQRRSHQALRLTRVARVR
jgi:hypothetical protein